MPRDVTIIGAGPAGSAAALLLARRGWAVTLVEQHRFPRGKVCGECLSDLGVQCLGRMGLLEGFKALHPTVLSHSAIHAGGSSVRLKLPHPMWGVSRSALDEFMLEAARRAGATILQPARCEGLSPGTVRVRMLEGNEMVRLDASLILVADGKSAILNSVPEPTGDFGIKTHFEDVDGPSDTIELFGCDGLYGGLAKIEGGRWNAAFSVPARRLRASNGNLESVFDGIVSENPVLGRRLSGARRVSEWLAAPLPRFPVRGYWPGGVIPIGNAAAALEPIGGEGMGLALRGAELAVDAILDSASGTENFSARIIPGYQRLWRVRRLSCRLAAVIVSRHWLSALSMPLVRHVRPIGPVALGLMGK